MSTSDLITHLNEIRLKESEILRSRNFELRRLEEECAQKDTEILRLRAIEADLLSQMVNLKNDHQNSVEHRCALEKEIANLRQDIAKNEARIQSAHEEYSRKLSQLADKVWAKDLELDSLKSEQAKSHSELVAISQMKSETERKIWETQQSLVEARSEVLSLRKELQVAHEAARSAENQARTDAQAAAQSILQSAREREEYVRRLEREIVELRGQLQSLRIELEHARVNVETRVEAAKELENQISQLRHALVNTRNEHASEIQSLIEENRVFVAKLKEKHRENISKINADFEAEKSTMKMDFSDERLKLAEQYDLEIDRLNAEQNARTEEFKRLERQMETEIARVRETVIGQEKQIELLSENNSELKGNLSNLQKTNDNLQAEVKSLQDIIRKLEIDAESAFSRFTDAKEESARERNLREKVEMRLDEAIAKNSELVSQIASLHEQISDNASASHRMEQEISSLRGTIRDADTAHAATKLELEAAQHALQNLQKSHEETLREKALLHSNEIKDAQLKRQQEALTWSARFNEQEAVVNQLRVELENKKNQLESNSLQLEEQKNKIASLTSQFGSTDQQLQATLREFESYRETTSRMYLELEERYAAFRLESARQLKDSQIAAARALRSEQARREEIVSSLRKEFEQKMTTERDERAALIERERQQQTARLENERAAQAVELAELERKLEALSIENANLKLAMNSKTSGIEAEQREFEIRSQHRERQISAREKQAAIREMQLQQYANSITEQKSEFVRQTKLLAEEVGTAAKMHPLKDYLKMTEFELSRIEVQLKLTPTISTDRSKLENYFEKMVEQRDFLTKVVSESEKKFAQQAQKLLELIRSPKMSPTPPPPPIFTPKVEPVSSKEPLSDSPVFEN